MATRFDKATTMAVVALAATFAGCAHDSFRSDPGNGAPGAALRATLAAQVANPAAALNPNPVAGLDGNSARAAIQRYEQTQGMAGAGVTAIPGMAK